jgi:hypothetical protein
MSNWSSMDYRSSISSMRHMSGLNSLTSCLGDLVLNISTCDLCYSVAVLNLNWDSFHLRVVNTVLGSNLTTSMLDSSLDRMSNSMSNWGSNMMNYRKSNMMSNWGSNMMSNREGNMVSDWGSNMVSNLNRSGDRSMCNISTIVGICFSISLSLSFPLVKTMVSMRSITDGVNHLLAQLFIFNLLSLHSLLGADILCCGCTGLGDQNHICYHTVGCRNRYQGMCSTNMSTKLVVRVSIRRRSC